MDDELLEEGTGSQVDEDAEDDAESEVALGKPGSTDIPDPPPEAAKPRRPRAERQKDRKAEHQALTEMRAELERLRSEGAEKDARLAELMGKVTDSSSRVADAVDRLGRPQPKPLADRIAEQLEEAAARVRPDDPEGTRAFLKAQAKIITDAADEIGTERARKLVGEEMAKLRKEMPRQPNPENLQFLAMAPWISEPRLNEAVENEISRLVETSNGKRNMKDQRTRVATITEAIVKVGKEWGRPVNVSGRRQESGNGPVVGAGSRTFANGGGDDLPELTPVMRLIADQDEALRKLPPEKRYKAMQERVKRNVQA